MARHLEPQQSPSAVAQHQKREQRSNIRVGTTNKSMNAIACAWFRKNVFQPCDGDLPCTMYFETVDWATSKPSTNSSPWIRRRSPLWILFAHPSDEIAQLATDLWPPYSLSRLPTPERRETRTMPAQDGIRLNDLRGTEQARPESGHPDHQRPVTAAQSKARRSTPQGDAELMAKEQVLGLKSARRLEKVYNEHCERMQDRKHRPRSCDDSTRRCDSKPDGIFGKDSRHQHWTDRICGEFSCIEHASALGAREPQVPLDGSSLSWKMLAGAGSALWLEQLPVYLRQLVDRDHAQWLSLLALHDR
jgi:hypothetical protein